MTEKCHYCGTSYHPMPVYMKRANLGRPELPTKINVCNFQAQGGQFVPSGCAEKAKQDGYIFRPDLTPAR